ncbi:MAG: T9SS type A sorting domain-containing protein [Saprospiraceae bacterium]
MKKIVFLLTFYVLISFPVLSQTPYNSNFEEWGMYPSKPYLEVVGWNTSNGWLDDEIINVTRHTDQVYSGNYAAKLQTKGFNNMVNASAAIGIFKMNSDFRIVPGEAYSYRPDSITGYYIYYPVSGDIFATYIILTKWNGLYRDTIGRGAFLTSDKVNTFNRFSFPVNYSSNSMPDSITFLITMANSLARPGSFSIVDNIQFIGGVSKNEELNAYTKLTLFPNPASTQINLNGLESKTLVEIYDLTGRLYYSDIHEVGEGSISTLNFPSGLYFIKAKGLAKLFNVVH